MVFAVLFTDFAGSPRLVPILRRRLGPFAARDSNEPFTMTTNDRNASTTRHRSVAGLTLLNACLLGTTLWIAFSASSGPLASRAEAAPPEQSSLDKDRAAGKAGQADPFDPAARQIEMLAEIKAIRAEVAALRDMMRSGSAKVSISNADEIKVDLDYKKLRDAMRSQ